MIPIKPDIPIKRKDDDVLNRKKFAIDLAELVVNYNSKESLVLGIYGSWGCGKTSIINMTKETFKELKDKGKPSIVIDFNPWNYPEITKLTDKFLETLKKNLISSGVKNVKELINLLTTYIGVLDLIPIIEPRWILIKNIIKFILKVFQKKEKQKQQKIKLNTTTIKEEINKILNKIDPKIIVIIDDIDRLTSREIKKVFQLIRMIADFNNTIYILTFDYAVVCSTLEGEQKSVSGKDYLDKIIQIPLKVPYAQHEDIVRILMNEINNVFSLDSEKFEWKTVHEMSLFQLGWLNMFNTLRSVKRFINLVCFEYSRVKEKVNRADFLMIIALKMFYPNVYNSLFNNKALITGTRRSFSMVVEDIKKVDKDIMDEMLKSFSDGFKNKNIALLYELFPYIKYIYENKHFGEEEQIEARKEGRICAVENFDQYFSTHLPDNHLSYRDIQNIIMNIDDQQNFENTLKDLSDKGTLWSFLYRFRDYSKDIKNESIPIIINSFLNISDYFKTTLKEVNAMPLFSSQLIRYIIFNLLMKIQAEENRFELIENAIVTSKDSIYTVIDTVNFIEGNHNNKRVEDDPDVLFHNRLDIDKLISLAVDRIRNYAKIGKLKTAKELKTILLCYKDWEKDHPLYTSNYEGIINSDEDLLNFLRYFISGTSHYSDNILTKKEIMIDIKSLKRITPSGEINEIQERIEKLLKEKSQLSDEQKELCELFIESSKEKQK